jgi:hypothetical protein
VGWLTVEKIPVNESTSVTRWLAGIATALVVAGLTAVPLALIYYEQRAQRVDTTLVGIQQDIVDLNTSLTALRSELQHPGGAYKRFTSDDGDRLSRRVDGLEGRVRDVERMASERSVLCSEFARRLDELEARVEDMTEAKDKPITHRRRK